MINDDFSTFKTHSAWFSQRGSQTLHDVQAGELEDFWRRRESSSAAGLPNWECLGPFNIAGRVTTLIAPPADTRRPGGGNCQSCGRKGASPNIGALAIDPVDPNVIYCATGEANLSPDCYPGTGLYVSHDGGGIWELLAAADTHNLPRRIGVLLPLKLTDSMLYLGGITLNEHDPAGLYASPDGGKTWRRADGPSTSNYSCHALVAHPRSE